MNPEHEPITEEIKNEPINFAKYIENSNQGDNAQELVDIQNNAYNTDKAETYTLFRRFYESLEKNYNDGKLDQNPKETQLFSFLSGGTLEPSRWRLLPLDLPDRSFERFIREELASIKPKQ